MKKSKMWGARGFMRRRAKRYAASESQRRVAEGAPAPVQRQRDRSSPSTYRSARRDAWRVLNRRKDDGRLPWVAFQQAEMQILMERSRARYLDSPKDTSRTKYGNDGLRAIRRRKVNFLGEMQR